jgi:hypothetical protein
VDGDVDLFEGLRLIKFKEHTPLGVFVQKIVVSERSRRRLFTNKNIYAKFIEVQI